MISSEYISEAEIETDVDVDDEPTDVEKLQELVQRFASMYQKIINRPWLLPNSSMADWDIIRGRNERFSAGLFGQAVSVSLIGKKEKGKDHRAVRYLSKWSFPANLEEEGTFSLVMPLNTKKHLTLNDAEKITWESVALYCPFDFQEVFLFLKLLVEELQKNIEKTVLSDYTVLLNFMLSAQSTGLFYADFDWSIFPTENEVVLRKEPPDENTQGFEVSLLASNSMHVRADGSHKAQYSYPIVNEGGSAKVQNIYRNENGIRDFTVKEATRIVDELLTIAFCRKLS